MKKYLMHTTFAPRTIARLFGLAIGLILAPQVLLSQVFDYGNAWYNPAVDYLKFKVAADGIYRVSAQQLTQAGFDTTGLNPANLHLIYRGQEQHIHIEPAPSGRWEFLEFFGRRNDAGLDTLMYVDPFSGQADGSLHPNPLVSTFSDTSVYYFFADNQAGLRLQTPFLGTVPPPLLVEEIVKTSNIGNFPGSGAVFRTEGRSVYDIFTALNPEWIIGEGYVGQSFSPTIDLLLPIPTPNALNNAPAKLYLRLESLQQWPQGFEIYLNGHLLAVDTIVGMFVKDYELAYPFPFVSDTQLLRIHIDQLTSQASDMNFLNVAAITYNATTHLEGEGTAIFPVSNVAAEYYQFHDVHPGNIAVAHDLVNHVRYADTIHADSLGIWITGQSTPGLVFLSGDSEISSPIISAGIGSSLSNTGNSANMVLITSRELDASAQAYRSYRQSSTVNPLNVKIVYTDEIYEEFGNGSPHPFAIKRFCKYAIDQWAVKPDYFMIWGKGKVDIRAGGINHVPAYGEPVSDNMYVSAFFRDSLNPVSEAAIGRVPLQTDQQGFDYVSKLAVYEQVAEASWMRNGIFVSGAADTFALRPINDYMDSFATDFRGLPNAGRATTYSWLNSVLEDSSGISQDSMINEGTSLVFFFGIHSTYMGIQDPATYTNTERLPILMALANAFCDFGDDTLSMGESWVLEPGKAAIATVGYSTYAYLTPLGGWGELFSDLAFANQDSSSLGKYVMGAGDSMVSIWSDQVYINHQRCMIVLGDPSIHFRTGTFEVWPGDANDDLIANVQDLLSIGLAYGDTGAVRPNASIQWMGYSASFWDSSFTNGTNHAHADCNGDGTIDANDTTAIVQNYGLMHNKATGSLGGSSDDPELAIESAVDTIPGGTRLELTVLLGSADHPADSVYGLFGIIPLDPELLDSTSFTISFDSCWLGTLGQNLLTMVHYSGAKGQVEFAITRTDHQPVSGHGEVARIGIVVIDNISGKFPGDTTLTPLTIAPAAAQMIDPLGTDLPLQGIGKRLFILGEEPIHLLPADQQLAVFPNPTSGEIYVQTAHDDASILRLYDPVGKLVGEEQYPAGAHKRLNMEHLRAGVYILKVNIGVTEYQVRITKVD